jgi:hypothetical protein
MRPAAAFRTNVLNPKAEPEPPDGRCLQSTPRSCRSASVPLDSTASFRSGYVWSRISGLWGVDFELGQRRRATPGERA